MSPPPEYEFEWSDSPASSRQPESSALPVDFSPPLIAMVVVVGAAFLIVTYFRLISRYVLPPVVRRYRRWRNRRRRRPSVSASDDVESPLPRALFETTAAAFHFLSPYGLDESVIKTIPLSVYTRSTKRRSLSSESGGRDCAVCLLEFEEMDYVRTLPVCSHAFHVDCIDIWLRSHANCPLCRAGVFRPESPFVPLMAARIRPSLDEGVLNSLLFEQRSSDGRRSEVQEITAAEASPRIDAAELDRGGGNPRDFLLKRSYSFSFERSLASDRMILEPATASPWRYRRSGTFWRRTSPFGSAKSRVFSFRYYRGMKSPFLRRRSYFPLSESSSVRYAGSSRRSKSLTSPIFVPSSAAAFSSSRLRCGDPEALLSPERLSRR